MGFEACVGVRRVVAFVVLDVDEYAMFFCCGEEGEVVGEGFDGGLGDQDVDFSFDSVERDRVVGCVWGEDCYCIAG